MYSEVPMKTRYAIMKCAEWLVNCVKTGWPKNTLADLERIWWEHHDDNGKLSGDGVMTAESKYKCGWLTCYAGMGLAGTEHCFAGGDSQNPDCPECQKDTNGQT